MKNEKGKLISRKIANGSTLRVCEGRLKYEYNFLTY